MAGSTKKVPKAKKRAIGEINVVKECRDTYAQKCAEQKQKIADIKLRLDVLRERGALSDLDERKEIAGEMFRLKNNLEILTDDLDCLRDNVDLFDELLTLLDSLFVHDRFKYIVKKIPEKKLPALVADPDKRDEVNELLISLLEECTVAWQKHLLQLKRRKEKRRHLQRTKQIFRERNEPSDDDIQAIIASFGTADNEEASTATQKKNKIG